MNKKGWMRIIEVFLAIMIIIGAMMVILSRRASQADAGDSIYERQRQILDLVSKNDSMRSEIVNTSNTANNPLVNDFILKLASNGWEFSTNICKIEEACPNPTSVLDRDVYTTEAMITSNLTYYNPRKLRLFVWVRE